MTCRRRTSASRQELLDQLRKRIAEKTVNVQVAPELVTAPNGGQYIALQIARSVGVASTSDGRYFVRVGDGCRPVLGDEVLSLLNDRPALPWETLSSLQVKVGQADAGKRAEVLAQLRASDRVKPAVKEKSDAEMLAHYGLSDGPWLTHLGVLIIGTARDRARLGTAPSVQAIKYDERGEKVNKWLWDDYRLSPVELVDALWQGIPDFHESYELPDGLHHQKLPAYDPPGGTRAAGQCAGAPAVHPARRHLSAPASRSAGSNQPGPPAFGRDAQDHPACQPAPQRPPGRLVPRPAPDGKRGHGL
ncbi:hypothetical protein [Paracoccus sp. (in: a-proteobacteria)]|uniref:hypothetical protein n=1 Tax=Paracoccus sp. TaxID=267 RepID=UPI002AFF8038|nr:hypothetical protein [Paracoccus sp. (in: a-proteobacteria)]